MLTWIAHNNIYNDNEIAGVDIDPKVQGELVPRFKEVDWETYHQALVDADAVPTVYSYEQLHYPQDVIIVTCGTPIDRNQNPDTSQVFSAIDALVHSGSINDDTLIIMRSTLFPGCSRLIRKRIHTRYGLFPDVVMAPERIAEGYTFAEIDAIPQIIGADTVDALNRTAIFFAHVFGSQTSQLIYPEQGGTAAAELAKLFCNTYRYVNFALANELAIICDENEVDFKRVRDACTVNYWRCDIAGAALNLGGPCLGKDAKTLASYTTNARITEAAYETAEKTAMYFVDKYRDDIRDGKVGILGLAFKRNSDNPMNSLSYKVKKQLEILGADVLVHDPSIFNVAPFTEHVDVMIEDCDVIFVMTEHDEYKDLRFREDQIVVRL
jgi:UDP-N-acetyl-D-mannosaminuronic acid dehydrogenase